MSRTPLAFIIGTLFAPALVCAEDITALWLEPSSDWYGIDGNWSSTGLLVGEPAQKVDVTVSTSLSEIWVVETGGCGASSLCTEARGGVYNTSASHSWSSQGAWQLGLSYLGLEGNGDYARETVAVYDSIRQRQTSFNKQIVAAINDTDYYTGFFGLGITPGNFQGVIAQSPIAVLVEQDGVIPSHSYGYTAGAYYGGSSGIPMSLTLGGYDANRFEAHDTKFSLNASASQPQTLIRAITASVSDADKAPTSWNSTSTPLSFFNESVTALIDSSTPYLWLPSVICDRFASTLNLTWNESFGLYLFEDNDSLERYQSSADLSFTFTLSSADNQDDFGQPLDVPGVVNITISGNAFVQNLRYPFMNLFQYGDSAVPYFPLKRADNESQIIIGKSFLQEAYIITNYETGTFSLHKAKFPEDPLRDTSIQTIAYAANSQYPGPTTKPGGQQGLAHAQLVGLVVGVCLMVVAILATAWFMRRRRRKQPVAGKEDDDLKDRVYAPEPERPKIPVRRMLSRMTKKCSWKKTKASGDKVYEVGADWQHERYEMPVQPAPVELDATDTMSSTCVAGFAASFEEHRRTSYELVRQQLESQRQGPVPEYTPNVVDLSDKTYQDVSWVTHYRPSDHAEQPSYRMVDISRHMEEPVRRLTHPVEDLSLHMEGPSRRIVDPCRRAEDPSRHMDNPFRHRDHPSHASSPTQEEYSNGVPSPMTPHSGWSTYTPDLHSPMGGSTSTPSMTYTAESLPSVDPVTMPWSASPNPSTSSHEASLIPPLPQTAYQRTPIDPSRVICLGPLPDTIHSRHHSSVARVMGPDGFQFPMPTIPSAEESRRESAIDTLGSNFTIDEEIREAATRAARAAAHTRGRMDGFDIVHVPQPAQKRYSWEEDR
ncbi:Uu.00g016570.m01.CDS01 [Anthostomella pinea]|uniref:Uu.00g016570.m01.CDS01 n=1 Tax=Anthostomella pinea TaxID=933095 RepID=A0AAI8VYQ9_9PEZI|nr:Uu.00g016570.m01.CDS01 [Anthostomella pinea]